MNSKHFVILIAYLLVVAGCSGTERFTSESKNERVKKNESFTYNESTNNILNPVRVLLQTEIDFLDYSAETVLNLYDSKNKVAIINKGNVLRFKSQGKALILTIADKSFVSDFFELQPSD